MATLRYKPAKSGYWRVVATYSGGVAGLTTYRGSSSKTKAFRVR
jgi:hypothetical protein